MNPASSLMSIDRVTRSPRGARGLNVAYASWMFRPGAFLSNFIVLARVQLEKVRPVHLEEELERLEQRAADHEPETAQEYVLRRLVGVGCARHLELRLSQDAELDAGARVLDAQRAGGRREWDVRPRFRVRRRRGVRVRAAASRQPPPAPRTPPTSPDLAGLASSANSSLESGVCADARRLGSNSADNGECG